MSPQENNPTREQVEERTFEHLRDELRQALQRVRELEQEVEELEQASVEESAAWSEMLIQERRGVNECVNNMRRENTELMGRVDAFRNAYSGLSRCSPPCEKRQMLGSSWWKSLGYNNPCGCAFKDAGESGDFNENVSN